MLLKRIFLFIIFSTLVIAQGFEGYVKLKIDSEGETMHVKYYKKGEDIRMEPELADVQMSGTMLFTGGSTYVIMPEQKMYMKIDMDKYSDMMPNDGEGEKEDDFKEPVKTGETKDILGYTTEKWIFEDDEYTSEVWVAEGLGNFMMMSTPMNEQEMPEWYRDLTNSGFFPMLVIAKSNDGSSADRMEVVEIEESSLSSDLFKVPSGYQEFSMPGGGGF